MKVVITGGTGFIGLNLARQLILKGSLMGPGGIQTPIDSIVLFDAFAPGERPSGLDDRVDIVTGDISDRQTVFGLIDRDDISVFHLASIVSGEGEKDFDLAMSVNLHGGLNIFEATRARAGTPRLVFASSCAVFGGSVMPGVVSDGTKQTSQTTYGVTKTIGELLINDYSRKGFFDGRSARLPTIFIRPGKPNAAASSFCSGVFREPLHGQACVLPVTTDVVMPMLGYRNCVQSFIALHEIYADALGDDRAVSLRSDAYSVRDMIDAVTRVGEANQIKLGEISVAPDAAIERIVASWPAAIDDTRAEKLGLPMDENIDRVVQDFIDDFIRG